MQKAPLPALPNLLALTTPPLAARAFHDFMERVKESTLALHETLVTGDGQVTPEEGQALLEDAFVRSRSTPRQRRVLELCAWPIFEKPALPVDDNNEGAFLWLFALPVLVRLPESRDEMLLLPEDALQTEVLVELMEQAGCLSPDASVGGFTSLYTREDLYAMGPQGLASAFVDAEIGHEGSLPVPLPVVRDPDIESARSALLYVLLAARMPARPGPLFNREKAWPLAALAGAIEQDLHRAGVATDRVEVFPGCSMTEVLLRCAGPGIHEIGSWFDLGIEHYGISSVYLVLLVDGIAELVGVTPDGSELLLAPSFAYVEPSPVLLGACAHLCEERGLVFKGKCASAIPTSAMLH